MKGAGKNGADIGANVLYRYQDGVLTNLPLWDPTTGKFPCGSVVTGMNDVPGSSCNDVHQRLNVNTNGCSFPSSFRRRAAMDDAAMESWMKDIFFVTDSTTTRFHPRELN